MRLPEILSLLRVGKPPAPYGVKRLARCYSIEDVAEVARRRLPLGSRAYLDTGGEDEYTLRRNRAAFTGSGNGGYIPAIRASQLGMRVALVERSEHLGGTCLNLGCIPDQPSAGPRSPRSA